MHAHPAGEQHYPRVEAILDSIADWITRYREAAKARAELRRCGPEEVARIAHELNIGPGELNELAGKRPQDAALLGKMLVALGVDPEAVMKEPLLARDLQRLCVACDHKQQCAHDLAAGTAGAHFREYCPNAYTLDLLLKQQRSAH
jgi:DNA-binding transcriptional LysR family regulator